MNKPVDPQALAEAVGAAMYARDPASQSLGMTLDAIALFRGKSHRISGEVI